MCLRSSLTSLAVLGIVGCSLLLALVAAAADPVIVDTRVPVSGVIADPCTTDPILFSEVVHTKDQMFTSGSQVHHAVEVNTENAKAQSVSGAVAYTLSKQLTIVTNADSGFTPFEVLIEEDYIVTRLGEATGVADDFRMKVLLKVTINANGAITNATFDIRAACN